MGRLQEQLRAVPPIADSGAIGLELRRSPEVAGHEMRTVLLVNVDRAARQLRRSEKCPAALPRPPLDARSVDSSAGQVERTGRGVASGGTHVTARDRSFQARPAMPPSQSHIDALGGKLTLLGKQETLLLDVEEVRGTVLSAIRRSLQRIPFAERITQSDGEVLVAAGSGSGCVLEREGGLLLLVVRGRERDTQTPFRRRRARSQARFRCSGAAQADDHELGSDVGEVVAALLDLVPPGRRGVGEADLDL